MKLPSHVLTRLTLAGTVATVGAVVTCDPPAPPRACEPIAAAVVDETPLVEVLRMTHDPVPSFAPLPPPPPPVHRPPPPPQVKPKPKPARTFANFCGRLVPIDPGQASGPLPECGRG